MASVELKGCGNDADGRDELQSRTEGRTSATTFEHELTDIMLD